MQLRTSFVLWLLLAGCEGSESVVEVGRLGYDENGQPLIQLPAFAAAGESFALTVTTLGDGCIELESTDVIMTGDGVDVTPYDRRRVPRTDEPCLTIQTHLPHEVALSFDAPGSFTVRVHGRIFNAQGEQFVEIPFSITIE